MAPEVIFYKFYNFNKHIFKVVTRKGHGPAADWWSYGVLMVFFINFLLNLYSTKC